MSWRRFNVLVKGLSPTSATVTRLNADRYIGGGKRGEKVNAVVGPKAAQAAFEAAFKPPARPPARKPARTTRNRRKRERPTRITS